MRKSIPMFDFRKYLRGDRRPPRTLIGMSFRLGIPWQVALQQSLPPLSRSQLFCNNRVSSVEEISADGTCLTSSLSQKRPQSTTAPSPTTAPETQNAAPRSRKNAPEPPAPSAPPSDSAD